MFERELSFSYHSSSIIASEGYEKVTRVRIMGYVSDTSEFSE